jgi:aminoglycoside 6'-N-acetyltransferase
VKLLARWLEQPHVARWYCDPEGDVAWARNPPAGGSQAIIRWGSAEIGYLRWQRVARPTLDALGLPEIPANSVDADILIGSEAATGQGVGPAALRAFIAETRRDPDVPMIGLTTELSNTRAHRAFEKAGFRIVRQYEAPRLGRCHLMILDLRPGQRLRLPEGGPDRAAVGGQGSSLWRISPGVAHGGPRGTHGRRRTESGPCHLTAQESGCREEIAMPSIKAIEVRLHVADVARSAGFYADVLGFEVVTLWPHDSPHFAILSRDGLRLQLGRREDLSVPTSHHAGTLWLDVAGLGDLYSTVEGKVNIE